MGFFGGLDVCDFVNEQSDDDAAATSVPIVIGAPH
jgi:hypothetical protein